MPQRLEVEDFSGGVTDYYLNAPPNKMKTCHNLLINQYPGIGKPFTRPGSELYDAANPQIPAGAQRIGTAFYYKNLLHLQSSSKLYYYNAGWVTVNGPAPTSNNAFIGATTTSYFTYAHWNYHTLVANSDYMYPKKVVVSNSNVPEVMEAGLPKFDISGISVNASGTGNNWLYKLVYKQDYTAYGNLQFSDFGAPSNSIVVSNKALNVQLNNIPVLANGTTSNFRTASIVIEIYRTANNGDVFYKCGQISNGTTTFTDSMTDVILETQEPLYTTGGVVENGRPPRCKLVHIMGDVAFYGNIKDDANQELNFRLYHSVPGDIDSVPDFFYVDTDDEIIAVSSTKNNAVLLCRNSIYRVDGFFDELGRGGMAVEKISDTTGCISAQCAVQALDGVFWLGADGAYFTDGFKVVRLNQDYDKTYRTFVTVNGAIDTVNNQKIQGKYDKKKNRIWWTVQRETAFVSEVDGCYVLDLNWGINENATFTTVGGQSFAPTAIEFVNGEMIRCDKRGYVFIHKDTLYADPKIDVSTPTANWINETIIYELESVAYNFGTASTRKYVTQVNVTCESTTNLSLSVVSNNDDQRKVAELLPIRYRGNIVWGEPDIYWGDATLEWDRRGLISEKRRMPAKNLRCNFKQLKLTNAKVAIINSDRIGTADIDSVAKTVTLSNIVSYDWPTYSVDYYIAFEQDDYTNEYLIVARTDDVLTYVDTLNRTVTTIGSKWVIRGYPKNEVLNLLNFSIIFEVSGPTLNTYKGAESGEVGA